MTYLILQLVISVMCLRISELQLQLELFNQMSRNAFVELLNAGWCNGYYCGFGDTLSGFESCLGHLIIA